MLALAHYSYSGDGFGSWDAGSPCGVPMEGKQNPSIDLTDRRKRRRPQRPSSATNRRHRSLFLREVGNAEPK